MSDDLTPAQIEAKLRRLVNDLTLAQSSLRAARDAEVDAKHAFESARRKALLSDDCPKVTRGGYTTAERDAWVAEQAAVLERTFDLAEANRKAAEDYLRTLRDQSMIVMALGKSVQSAFSLAGVS
ncbi:hypothetical protein AMIS_21380 [Actinoplanes missouriensis 431]|uniref:Uncharacterized protein n=1 Tax=Actinoplanes missouriensis (strain ATCC 14538 / DSM 43046 / CBS 188.64 / JCM 3121 / NBRC 102363 / NCIMB 12654 / NRRL B-3342 / UNCC 431) TaxID=512565 RepID=I0H2X1_ACTM4|nr:hypothetical protein [Actinoplanes missouriensis]BAL87358.1 hypothetical protein AMIS_21380 [Actinoplanes missouriensis 431]